MRALVVHAHPARESLSGALYGVATKALSEAGHEVTGLDLYAEGFQAAMSAAEREAYPGDQPICSAEVARHADLVRWADTLVFVYPTWWTGLPAVMKGWLERVLVPGVAFHLDERNRVASDLRHVRRVVGITTYGSSWPYVKVMNDAGRRTLLRALAMLCARPCRRSWLALYSVDNEHGRRAGPLPGQGRSGAAGAVRTLVVHAHPLQDSFSAAVRDRAVAGLQASGHDIDLLDLYADGFEPGLSLDEWRAHDQGIGAKPDDVKAHALRLRQAQALVLVYPTWWGGPPAILKGWLDRVWVEGIAYTRPAGSNRVRPLLRDIRRLVAVTTHGSPKWINAIEGEPGKRLVLRQMRSLCHPLVRTRWLALYGVDQSDEAGRTAFLDKVERTMTWRQSSDRSREPRS